MPWRLSQKPVGVKMARHGLPCLFALTAKERARYPKGGTCIWFMFMTGDLPSAGADVAPGDDASRSVTDVPHVPRLPSATETDATQGTAKPVLVPEPGTAALVDGPVAASSAAAPVGEAAVPLDPVAAASAAGGLPSAASLPSGQPGLLYYAVYLPTPSGVPGGLPLFLPAASGATMAPPALPVGAYAAAAPQAPAPALAPAPPLSVSAAQAHNQKILVTGIIAAVFLVHLPWLVYLFAVHACWGTFLESCYSVSAVSAEDLSDPFAEASGTPMLFARVIFFVLRVQAVLAGDWGQFSQAMQVSTGAGSFVLTRIVAANGLVAEGRLRVWLLAASCAFAFGLLFWAELHLLGDQVYPELGAQTVLAYIDQNLPVDFLAYSNVEASLKGYLQFLRLADALILGAALAMPTTRKSA